MTSKQFVQSRFPKARAERHKTNGGEAFCLIRVGDDNMYFAEGATESKAWVAAREKIEGQANKAAVAKLSRAQVETLAKLEAGPCETTRAGYGRYVSGMSAKSLIDRGMVERTDLRWGNVVRITDAGRAALAEAKQGSER